MRKHTPGQIKEQPNEITTVYLQAVLMPQGEIISQGKTIGWFKDCKKFLVDARLIAAAPELLEACKQAYKAFRSGGDITKMRAENMIEQAIAKATQ
jgi:hypothetical protein